MFTENTLFLLCRVRIQFTAGGRTETRERELRDGEDWRSGGDISLTGLTPSTNYSIAVTAVNVHRDVGLYSDPVTIQTFPVNEGIATISNV